MKKMAQGKSKKYMSALRRGGEGVCNRPIYKKTKQNKTGGESRYLHREMQQCFHNMFSSAFLTKKERGDHTRAIGSHGIIFLQKIIKLQEFYRCTCPNTPPPTMHIHRHMEGVIRDVSVYFLQCVPPHFLLCRQSPHHRGK